MRQTAIKTPTFPPPCAAGLRLHPHSAHRTLDQPCKTPSALDVPHQGTALLHSPTARVGRCRWVGAG